MKIEQLKAFVLDDIGAQRYPKRVDVHEVMRKRDKVDYWPSARDFDFELASPQLGLAL